jgi:hypothetical protein
LIPAQGVAQRIALLNCLKAGSHAVRLDLLHYFPLQNAFGIFHILHASHTHTHTHSHDLINKNKIVREVPNTPAPLKNKNHCCCSCCLKKSGGLKVLGVEISSHGCPEKGIQLAENYPQFLKQRRNMQSSIWA